MGLIIGPTPWWQASFVSACPVGTTLPDGSKIISKAGGTAYIVAPACTQVGSAWAGGQYNSTLVGDKCCIFEWPGLNTLLIQRGFNPCDWCVPSIGDLFTFGYVCRANWDTFSFPAYWSSTELVSTDACNVFFDAGIPTTRPKNFSACVRAFRRVTY
jgi:hypothetical protein